jgi:hypothetical protein
VQTERGVGIVGKDGPTPRFVVKRVALATEREYPSMPPGTSLMYLLIVTLTMLLLPLGSIAAECWRAETRSEKKKNPSPTSIW